jgi:HEAT repeat protein
MDGALEQADRLPRPDESAMDVERRQIVRQALARLGRPNREALSLFYVDGLSYADIAGYLGVTEATVLGRLQRGRSQLKKELLTMVEDTFKQQELPEDFAAQVEQLLAAGAAESQRRQDALGQLMELGAPAVDPLCEAMGDPRPMIRRLAARALCLIGDARALRPIMRRLYAGDHWLYSTIFHGGNILRIPGARDELLRLAREGEFGDAYWAIQALGHAADDTEVWDFLLGAFRDATHEAAVRGTALASLCRLRPDLAAELVVEGLRDPQIRQVSGWAWWIAFKDGLVVPLDVCLSGFTRDVAPNARFMAGRLALRHGKTGIEALEELLHSGGPVEREAAAAVLARRNHPEAFDVLVDALRRGRQARKWRRILARELMRNYPERLIEWVRTAEPDLSSSHELAWALARARMAAGQATPADLLDHGPPTLRADALRKHVAEAGPAALPELRRCLAEGKPKKLAREAFWRMLALRDAAEPVARDMLNSPLWTERKAAVSLLRRWGKLTLQQQAEAGRDPHVAVRHAAEWHPSQVEAAKRGHPKWARKIAPRRP